MVRFRFGGIGSVGQAQAVNRVTSGGRLWVRPVCSHTARALGENTLRWKRVQVGGGGETEELSDAQRNSDTGKMRVTAEVRGTATKGRPEEATISSEEP